MRRLVLAFCLAATPVAADTSLSAEIVQKGIAATEARLSAVAAPTPEDLFALAGLRFLSGVESALQLRWQTGIRADWSELPILRLPIPENPAPRPFAGADVEALFRGLDADMAEAREALAALGGADFGLEIRVADLWFDIDGNGQRTEGEDAFAVGGMALGSIGGFGAEPVADPVIRFDTADAAWLGAYTHLLSGFAKTALAFDPAPAVDKVIADTAAIHALWGNTPPPNAMDMMFGRQVDRVVMILDALETRPNPALAKEAHAHLISMIAENRRFWSLVAAETDNDREWVPNDTQQSGLGLPVPPGTGARWQAVLADAEAVLTGKLLVPHWRFGAEAGIDLKAMFDNPPPLEPAGLIHGRSLLPYARKGPRVTPESWLAFRSMVEGQAGLYAVFLN